MHYTPAEYKAQLDRAREAAKNQPCPTCRKPMRTPCVAVVPPNDMQSQWYAMAFCSHACGGSWFRP